MTEINDGGPAFPQPIDDMGTFSSVTEGMSLRDYFAGQVLIEFCKRTDITIGQVASITYLLADAMIEVRNK